MHYFLKSVTLLSLLLLAQITLAQEVSSARESHEQTVVDAVPQVGKHVMANTDASGMILSLFIVLALIIVSALVLKRFNFFQQNTSQLKVIANLSLGSKERLVVVQVGSQQLVLGVTAQQITLIEALDEPISLPSDKSLPLSSNVLAFLQKTNNK
ncbi:MAG: flagellar biosynthetic protein FliO [Litorilituus sp.]|jgi:flagellar protein FliO/FliZ|nr:flagellar biosynthetic protein FliO [Litorilituus sp.]